MDVKDRINKFIVYKGISVNQFEQSIGASNGYWRKVKNISAKIVGDILRVYSELSADWIITGQGDMFRNEKQTSLIQSINGDHNIATGHSDAVSINADPTDNSEVSYAIILEGYKNRLEKQDLYIKQLLEEQKILHAQISKLIDKLN